MFQEFEVTIPMFNSQIYDIREWGAVCGGSVSNTKAINEAIEAASVHGGRVVIPNGIWLTGPIWLKSNVELHLEDNAILLFTKNKEEYPLVVTDFEGITRIRAVSQINAFEAENIAVTGKGIINGSGHLWRPVKQFKMTQRQWKELLSKSKYVEEGKEGGIWMPTESIYEGNRVGEIYPNSCKTSKEALEAAAPYYDFYRPVMVSLRHCKNILIEDVNLQNSPAWNVHPYFCEHLTVRGVTINNPYYAQNGDGIDVDSCNYVHIHHCNFQTGDDGICLKSGKDRAARLLKKPCENVLIHDCKVGQSHGGFVIGSEMSRGVRNVLVKDCTFIDSDVGLRFKSAMGRGGVVEDIYIQDINMINIKEQPLIMTMNYVLNQLGRDEAVAQSTNPEDVPEFRNIYLKRCVCVGAGKEVKISKLDGFPQSIHDIYFEECAF